MITITKKFINYPAAHRLPFHDGLCHYLHGHDWSFDLTFTSEKVDDNGFILDFGKMQFIKDWLEANFNHTALISVQDPEVELFKTLGGKGVLRPVLLRFPSCEGIARHVFDGVTALLRVHTSDRVRLVRAVVWEDSKNSATVDAEVLNFGIVHD